MEIKPEHTAMAMREQTALNIRCALRTILDDTQATYDMLAKGNTPEISLGQFRRLASARQLLREADAE